MLTVMFGLWLCSLWYLLYLTAADHCSCWWGGSFSNENTQTRWQMVNLMYLFLESIESRFAWTTFQFKLWFTFCWNFSAWKRPKSTTRRGIQYFSVLLMLKYFLFEPVLLCKSVFLRLSLLYILLTVDRDDPESVEICFEDIKCLDPEGYLTSTIMNFYIRLV